MEELFFLVRKRSPDGPIETVGCVTRTAAHMMGFVHTSVLLIPITWDEKQDEPAVFLHKRSSAKRVSPNTWDFCGGHLTFENWHCQYLQSELDPTHLLERLAEETALREANEELKCDPPFQFQSKHLLRFKQVGYFECDNKTDRGHNVEYSTAFVVSVPFDRKVSVWDTDTEGERELEVRRCSVDDLLAEYRTAPHTFADGAGRILEKLVAQATLQQELILLMEELTKPKQN